MKISKKHLVMLGLAAMLATGSARAAEADGESADQAMEDVRTMLGTMSASANDLAKKFADSVKWGGDFRYRYEKIDSYGLPPLMTGRAVNRERYRIRLRLNAEGKVNSDMTVKVRVATGSSDPVSTNQTIGAYADKKGIVLDIAQMTYEPKGMILGPKAQFGKMATPFYSPGGELIFDGDLTPEGIALGLKQDLGMGLNLAVTAGQFINDELSGSVFDPKFEGEQAVLGAEIMGWDLKVSAAYYNWINKNAASYAAFTSQDSNTPGIEFNVVDSTIAIGGDVAGVRTELYYEYEKNSRVTNDNDGYIAGLGLASGKLIPWDKDWLKLEYNYRSQKKDATFSPWNFSDFAGGKTDAMGSMVSGKIKVMSGVDLGLTYFSNQLNLKSAAVGGRMQLYERWQGDLAVKF